MPNFRLRETSKFIFRFISFFKQNSRQLSLLPLTLYPNLCYCDRQRTACDRQVSGQQLACHYSLPAGLFLCPCSGLSGTGTALWREVTPNLFTAREVILLYTSCRCWTHPCGGFLLLLRFGVSHSQLAGDLRWEKRTDSRAWLHLDW